MFAKVTHQIDSKNERLHLSAGFTAKLELVFLVGGEGGNFTPPPPPPSPCWFFLNNSETLKAFFHFSDLWPIWSNPEAGFRMHSI